MISSIFLTTPTSATASFWRILTRLSKGVLVPNRFTDSYYQAGNLSNLTCATLPLEDNLILYNVPSFFNFSQTKKQFKYIINVRDPRDLLCNMYHWALIHPEPNLTKEQLKQRSQEIIDIGIDKFVLDKDITSHFENIIKISKEVDDRYITYCTYKNLCCDFDKTLKLLSNHFNVDLNKTIIDDLSNERVENLEQNNQWIGNKWSGSDVLPGRYIRELKKETQDILQERYKKYIEFCDFADERINFS